MGRSRSLRDEQTRCCKFVCIHQGPREVVLSGRNTSLSERVSLTRRNYRKSIRHSSSLPSGRAGRGLWLRNTEALALSPPHIELYVRYAVLIARRHHRKMSAACSNNFFFTFFTLFHYGFCSKKKKEVGLDPNCPAFSK